MTLHSRTIPCKKCGKKGDTTQIWAGWYCKDCLDKIQAVFDKKKETGSLFRIKADND